MMPLIYLRDASRYLLTLGLQILSFGPTCSKPFAGTVLFIIPIVVNYPVFKRYITEGLTVGALKS